MVFSKCYYPGLAKGDSPYSRLQDLYWGARTAELAVKRSDSPRQRSRPSTSLKRSLIGHRSYHPWLNLPLVK
ncbi:hypothetical protein R50073_35990 [Maricurvus nonylphenolicus]